MLRKRIVALALICTLLGAARAETTDYVRLHVIADNDGEAAQALKLIVRDACLSEAQTLLKDCDSADEAWEKVNESLPLLTRAAVTAAREQGWTGFVRVETGTYDFPERQYGDATVPAGEYRALRVIIGAGAGHNWWCVLYPSLCLPEDFREEPPEDDPAQAQPIEFYSSILEWIKGLFGGDEP